MGKVPEVTYLSQDAVGLKVLQLELEYQHLDLIKAQSEEKLQS